MANTGVGKERYNFNATEDDHLVSNILLDLKVLIRQSDSTNLRWAIKKRRSALNSTPTPPRVIHSPPPPPNKKMKCGEEDEVEKRIKDCKNKEERVHSPSSPLGYSPNEADNNIINIQSNQKSIRKSKKRKLKDWENHIEELKQTKEQLILTLDNVKNYQRTVLEFNIKLKAKRDELNGEQNKVNINVEKKQLHHHQIHPIIYAPPQQQEYTVQQATMTLLQYYPSPFFPATNGGVMGIMNGSRRPDDKIIRAADARKRRMLKINIKKNSVGIRK